MFNNIFSQQMRVILSERVNLGRAVFCDS